jgi:hypothetical protein
MYTDEFVLGGLWNGGTAHSPECVIDELRISNLARNACWIGTEYNNESAPGTYVTAGTETPNAPTAVAGDLWMLSTDPHLQFLDNTSTPQKLAFVSDVTTATANAVLTTGSYSDPTWLTSLAGSKITGDISGNAGGLSNPITEGQVTGLTGDLSTLTSAISTETTNRTAADALKANLAGGNAFTTGKQVLAAADTGYASLNVPNATNAPTRS